MGSDVPGEYPRSSSIIHYYGNTILAIITHFVFNN